MKSFECNQSDLEDNSLFNRKPVKILKQRCDLFKFTC